MNNYKIAVLTNNKAVWAIRPFSHLFNRFWDKNQPVDVVGFTPPDFELPNNFNFISLDNNNWPSNKWTNQLIAYLGRIKEDYVILMLEDYWLDRPVNLPLVAAMLDYIQTDDDILRIDLTADRMSMRSAVSHDMYNGYEIIRTPPNTLYQMSYQAGIWNKKRLLEVLIPNQNAWDSEVKGTLYLREYQFRHLKILGTKEYPVRYIPVLRRNKTGIQAYMRFNSIIRKELDQLIPEEIIK